MMFRPILLALICGLTLIPTGVAQDTGPSLLSAARKQAAMARGKKGEERKQALEESLRILHMVPQRFPGEKAAVARAWLEIGRTERRLGRPAAALKALEKAASFEGEERTVCLALHDLATLHKKARRPEKARAALQRIIDDHPGQGMAHARALVRQASLLRAAKQTKEAEELLRRCLKEHGDLWRQAIDALDALASLKLRAGDPEEARRLLETHGEAIKARFQGTRHETRVDAALGRMKSRARLEKKRGGGR